MKKKQLLIYLLLLLIAGIVILLLFKLFTKTPSSTSVKGVTAPELIAVEDLGNKQSSKTPDEQAITISHTVEKGDTIGSIAKKYEADAQTIVDYPYNQIDDSLTLKVGQILIIPKGYMTSPITIIGQIIGSGILSWPVTGQITQQTSWFHPGAIDISSDVGDPVLAAKKGTVVKTEKLTGGYGWYIVLDHQGITSLYAHLSAINVYEGDIVEKGQKIGEIGVTGRSTGPHLHFETKENGQPVDPLALL